MDLDNSYKQKEAPLPLNSDNNNNEDIGIDFYSKMSSSSVTTKSSSEMLSHVIHRLETVVDVKQATTELFVNMKVNVKSEEGINSIDEQNGGQDGGVEELHDAKAKKSDNNNNNGKSTYSVLTKFKEIENFALSI